MAAHGAILRPSSVISAAKSAAVGALSARRAITRFARPSAFSLPANGAALASRFARNFAAFRIHYALLLWFSLLAFLFPSHRAAMLFLMFISKVVASYAIVLRVFPNSTILQRFLDRRIVSGIFLAVVIVQLALAGAVAKLFLAIAAVAPVVAAHVVFRTPDASSGGDGDGKTVCEMDPIREKKDADLESGGPKGSDRSA